MERLLNKAVKRLFPASPPLTILMSGGHIKFGTWEKIPEKVKLTFGLKEHASSTERYFYTFMEAPINNAGDSYITKSIFTARLFCELFNARITFTSYNTYTLVL